MVSRPTLQTCKMQPLRNPQMCPTCLAFCVSDMVTTGSSADAGCEAKLVLSSRVADDSEPSTVLAPPPVAATAPFVEVEAGRFLAATAPRDLGLLLALVSDWSPSRPFGNICFNARALPSTRVMSVKASGSYPVKAMARPAL